MKNLLPRLCVMLLFVLITSCEKENLSIENQVINQENEKIFIDGVEHNFLFKENTLGEISLDKEQDVVLSKFIEENENMSYYYDKQDVLHMFKNSDDMKEFMENDTKSNFIRSKNNYDLSSKVILTDEIAHSSLKIYDGTNYNTLLFTSNLNEVYPSQIPERTDIPDLRATVIGGLSWNTYNFNDKASSIILSMKVPIPMFNPLDISYAILYSDLNYSGYSLGISTTTYNEYDISDLHQIKMYREWFKTRYWGDRATSLKHYY